MKYHGSKGKQTYAAQLSSRRQPSRGAEGTVAEKGAQFERIFGRRVHLCDFPFENLALLIAELVHGIVPARTVP